MKYYQKMLLYTVPLFLLLPSFALASVSLTYEGTSNTTGGASSYTITAAALGAQASDRDILVAVSEVGTEYPSVTVEANNAPVVIEKWGTALTDRGVALYCVNDPSSATTGDIVITAASGNLGRTIVGWWRVSGSAGCTSLNTQVSEGASTPQSVNLTTTNGAAALAAVMWQGNAGVPTIAWTGTSGDYSANPAGFTVGAGSSAVASSSSLTITASAADASEADLIAASFDVAGGGGGGGTGTTSQATSTLDKTLDIEYDGVILYLAGFFGVLWIFKKR